MAILAFLLSFFTLDSSFVHVSVHILNVVPDTASSFRIRNALAQVPVIAKRSKGEARNLRNHSFIDPLQFVFHAAFTSFKVPMNSRIPNKKPDTRYDVRFNVSGQND